MSKSDFIDCQPVRYPSESTTYIGGKRVKKTIWISFTVCTASADWLARFEAAKR